MCPIRMTFTQRCACLSIMLASLGSASPACSAGAEATQPGYSAQRRITQLIGANGWPTSDNDIRFWQSMGLSWGRDSVGPGQSGSRAAPMKIDRTGPEYDQDLAPIILRNNANHIQSLLLLAYTPRWNASVPGDGFSAPKDVSAWERYVEAVVKKYSAPPYDVKYFQIWNEAAGPLSGGSPQATFWHGPGYSDDPKHASPYADAMRDYVERIHIPAARIIRRYHAYVVYGGWPDQGGIGNYIRWLEYRSTADNSRMLDWVDYVDVHYLGIDSLETLYKRYVATGKIRGVWQTEIGDTYINDPNYLPTYFFDLAVWALDRHWDDPDKYVSMIYHWDGVEAYRLTNAGPPRTYNPSGRSLITLKTVLPDALASFHHNIEVSPGLSAQALMCGDRIVFQVTGAQGQQWLRVTDLPAPASGRFRVAYLDAIDGAAVPDASIETSWSANRLSVSFHVPAPRIDAEGKGHPYLGYLVVTHSSY